MSAFETDSKSDRFKTGESDESVRVTNDEFLHTVFELCPNEARPVVVSFHGNPGKIEKSAWFGRPWTEQNSGLTSNKNNYFSLASFRPDESGQYRRRKTQFVALHAIMLDDVGTKVNMERLTIPPS
jgi:hypothetical protein